MLVHGEVEASASPADDEELSVVDGREAVVDVLFGSLLLVQLAVGHLPNL